jgi:MoaA/NifB/PqqE/SkfB family radical SAM enzyme
MLILPDTVVKKLARKLGWRIYHAVHTNGLVADAVYRSAFYIESFWRSLKYKWFLRRGITPEELWKHRYLQPSAILIAGVTNICNAKCSFCAYPKVIANKTLQTGIMSFAVFKKLVDEWASVNGQNLDLTPVVGDPLVDPGLLEKINYAINHARIRNVFLTTNAILLDRNDAYKQLIDLGISGVFISTQGTSREAYEKVYGVKHYDEAMSGIRHLLEYNRKKGEPACIIVRFRNAEKPSQIIRSKDFTQNIKPYLSEKVRINFTVDFDNWGGTILPTDMSGFMKLRKSPPRLDVPCRSLFGFAVSHDGSVRLCGCRLIRTDLDDLVVGNIREKSLEEISKGEEAWSIIKGFYFGKRPATCVECTIYSPIDRSWLEHRARNDHTSTAAK